MKKVNISILLGLVVFLLSSSAFAAEWYKCQVTSITTKQNGVTDVRFIPGTNENKFTDVSNAQLNPDDYGAKNMLATLLTAVSMNKQVRLHLDDPPSLTYQYINNIRIDLE